CRSRSQTAITHAATIPDQAAAAVATRFRGRLRCLSDDRMGWPSGERRVKVSPDRHRKTGRLGVLQRRTLMASGAALTLTSAIPAAWAATPKDTVVFASQIDDLITFDPGEAYEISAQIIASDIYDRLVRYEAEDMTKLVGGVAQSWTVSPDAKTFTFKLRPNQKFESGATVTADDMAFSLQRVVILDKTPAFLFTQLGWNKDNVKTLITAPDESTLKFTITENFAPSLVLNLMATVAASVVEKKVAMANE